MNNVYLIRADEDVILAKPEEIASITFMAQEDVNINGYATFQVARKGILHGLCGWHKVRLAEHSILSNYPKGQPLNSWQQCFFPITEPLAVTRGDRVHVTFESFSDAAGGYQWRWEVVHRGTNSSYRYLGTTLEQTYKVD